jgi:hypothetical protein
VVVDTPAAVGIQGEAAATAAVAIGKGLDKLEKFTTQL